MKVSNFHLGFASQKDNLYDWEFLISKLVEHKGDRKCLTILEVGAAISGINRTKILAKLNGVNKVIGVELREERIPKEKYQSIEYRLENWESLSKVVKENSIDLLVSSHCIEHVNNSLLAINETYKVLKKGGVALVSTPNRKRFVMSVRDFLLGEREFPLREHVREYTEKDIVGLINASHFNIKNCDILPYIFGLYSGILKIYLEDCPRILKKYANFYLITLRK